MGSPLPDPVTDQIYASMIAGDSQLRMNQMVQDMQNQQQLQALTTDIMNAYNQMANPHTVAVVPDQFGPFLSKTQKRKKEKKEFMWAANEHHKEWLKNKSPNAMADLEGTNINEDLDLERML